MVLVFGTLSFWLREAGVSRSDIGYFSWVVMAYSVKWMWSPLADRFEIPWLYRKFGRRRSWLLLSQLAVMLSIFAIGTMDPQQNLALMAIFAVILAVSSATQDISVDAYRIESAPEQLQAALAAAYQVGYRLAMILASAGTLWLAAMLADSKAYQLDSWQKAYAVMALCMLPCILTTLLSKEPISELAMPQTANGPWWRRFACWLEQAVIDPFIDFFRRYQWHALLILALIACYRMSDVVMGVMANTFYVDMEFTKEEVAGISKVYGVIMTLAGAALGGVLLNRFGTLKILFVGGVLSAITNVLFSMLSIIGHDLLWLTLVISADNLSAGIATSAFIAYLSSLVNRAFTATQYAILSSLMLLLPKFVGGFSGDWVNYMGYSEFFILTALLGIPALVLILILARVSPPPQHTTQEGKNTKANGSPADNV